MAFVPEGQADSSQARSAWIAMQRDPVPEGRSKSLSVPQIFVVETEPRHEQATARRMLMLLQKRQVFLWKSSGPMIFDLILDGMNGFWQLRDVEKSGESRPMIQPLFIERFWRWELWLAMTAADERGLQPRRCIWA
jgi:hypothetical protein